MTSVLILTEPRDFHSYAVAEALRLQGVEVALWHGTDFPSRQKASAWLGGEGFGLEVSGPEIGLRADLRAAAFDTVWNRRPSNPVLPEDLHPADRVPAGRDCQHFVWALWHLIAPHAFWVNPLSPIPTAILKPYQLRLACELGLEIPRTLCSNDPDRIVEFLRAHPGETVYKSFHAGSWKTKDGVAMLFTKTVTEEDLPADEMLQAAPGIFQVRIPKDHELRVTFFGERPVAARLASQSSPGGRDDWRRAFSDLEVEPAHFPEELARKCRSLMESLGLVFACFDFIVTPDGRYVFLEVNPMGQFLFLERLCPELPLLDLFCSFLTRGAVAANRPAGGVRLLDVWDLAETAFLAAPERHVRKKSKVVPEEDEEPVSALESSLR